MLALACIIVFMKKRIRWTLLSLFYLLLSVCAPFFTPRIQVAADTDAYACICTDDAYFYSSREEKHGLFLLPETYFVKVLAIEGEFSKIEYLYDDSHYKKLTGYAKTSALTFVDYTPKRPYLYYLLDVRYTIDDGYFDGSDDLGQLTVTCAYYGDYNVGSKTYCYVLRGDSFGYIPKPSNLSYEQNPEYAERLEQTSNGNPTPPTQSEEGMSPLQIGILVAVCLLVPTLVALIAKSSKRLPYEQEE